MVNSVNGKTSKPYQNPLWDKGSPPAYTPKEVERISQIGGYSALSNAATANWYGLNPFGNDVPVPYNNNSTGLIFFTRPCLNLTTENILSVREFNRMLNPDANTIARGVRAYLDPLGSNPVTNRNAYHSPLVDPYNAFISILTNNCMNFSGFPDIAVEFFDSTPGRYKEQFGFVDGLYKYYGVWDGSATFRNTVGDPLTYMFYVWTQYAARVHEGSIDPYPSMLINNEIDSNTRIYRLELDQTRQYVTGIAASGASTPASNPIGNNYNYTAATEKPYNQETDTISINFHSYGAEYLDPITIREFNVVVTIFNNAMQPKVRDQHMVRLNIQEQRLFRHQCYPFINESTSELMWFTWKSVYNQFMKTMPANPYK